MFYIGYLLMVIPSMITFLCFSVLAHQLYLYRLENGGNVYVDMYNVPEQEYNTKLFDRMILGLLEFRYVFGGTDIDDVIYIQESEEDNLQYTGYATDEFITNFKSEYQNGIRNLNHLRYISTIKRHELIRDSDIVELTED